MNAFVPINSVSSSFLTRPYRPRTLVAPRSTRPLRLHRRSPVATAHPRPTSSPDSPLAPEPASHPPVAANGFALHDAPFMEFAQLPDAVDQLSAPGAYAIRDADNVVQYMGYSKNIAAKLQFHSQLRPNSCSAFQVYLPPLPAELISPQMLESVLEFWVRETGAVPPGNNVDRALWENPNPIDRKPSPVQNTPQPPLEKVPIRERSTPPRSSPPRATAAASSTTSFSDPFRPSSSSRSSGWAATDEDFVDVDVDPFDPFSASKRREAPRAVWGEDDLESPTEEWFPILAVVGVGTIAWLIGVLGNALPAATPSMGM